MEELHLPVAHGRGRKALECRGTVSASALTAAILALLWSLSAGAGQPSAEPVPGPLWPLRLPDRYLTSNFMEHRYGRFHTALDLKTNSRSGYAALAVEDGWIVRLRTSPFGYGRAVYLEGRSGRTYVYAHLSRFADKLRPSVREAQQRLGSYTVDLNLQQQRIPVQRGEVIALTGQSGSLGPHLHFEVRNAAQQPLNPLRCGFSVPDSIPPEIRKIRVLPASAEARVVGGLSARSVSVAVGLHGDLPPLVVQGEVAFTAEVQDATDIQRHRLTPYALTVRLDGEVVYNASNDSLSYRQNRQMMLEWLELEGVREKWLHRRSENNLPGRFGEQWSLNNGGLDPGLHRVEVEAVDWSDNRSVVAWDLVVVESQDAAPVSVPSGWAEDPARVALPMLPDGSERWLTPFLVLVRSPTGEWSGHDALTYATTPADRRFLIGQAQQTARQTVLWAVPDSLSEEEVTQVRQQQGLKSLGLSVVVVGVDHYNWNNPLVSLVSADLPADSLATVGVYLRNRDGGWNHVESPLHPEPAGMGLIWHVPASRPGRYALFRDTLPPELGLAHGRTLTVVAAVERNREGVSLPRWEILRIPWHDAGSGVDPASIHVWCDGRERIAEPDPLRQRLLCELPDDLALGEHELILQAADYAGNTSLSSLKFVCEASADSIRTEAGF